MELISAPEILSGLATSFYQLRMNDHFEEHRVQMQSYDLQVSQLLN